jgi:hypothetical protein
MITRRLAAVGLALALASLALTTPVLADQEVLFWDSGKIQFDPEGVQTGTDQSGNFFIYIPVFVLAEDSANHPLTGPIASTSGKQTITFLGGTRPTLPGAYGTFSGQVTYVTRDGSTLTAIYSGVFVNPSGTAATFTTTDLQFRGDGRLAGVTATPGTRSYFILPNAFLPNPDSFDYDLIGKLTVHGHP